MWPILFDAAGTIIYSYPLFIGLSWGLGYRLSEAAKPSGLSPRVFAFWMLGLFLSSWIGAKLLFLVTQNRWATEDLIRASNFWLGGGFVFLGGFLGGLSFTVLVGQWRRELAAKRMQFTIIPLLWAHALGRVGCFLAGCCYGRVSELPWSLTMHGHSRHPVQLYEALGLALLAYGLQKKAQHHLFLAYYLLGYGLLRWLVEWWRGDELRGLWWLQQSTSQLLSLGLVSAGLILWFRLKPVEKTG